MQLDAGQKVGGYEIVAPIGEGGMGEVYRARDPKIDREVALKILPESFAKEPDRMERFEREARAAGALNHPNIVTVHEVGTDGRAPYLAMELLEGESLRERLTPVARSAGSGDRFASQPIAPRRAVEIARQIASGLAAAHEKGVIHRDLKPENIFITRDGRVKILDFGLAKLSAGAGHDLTDAPTMQRQTSPGVVLGTVGYMSPEQVHGKTSDHRTDIFAFGVILYEMLSGRRAFSGESTADMLSAILKEDPPELLELAPSVSPALDRIVRHCLEKNPEQRFQSARDLEFDLDAQSLSGSSGSGLVAVSDEPQHKKAVVIAALIGALLLTGFLGASIGSRFGGVESPDPIARKSFRQITFASGLELYPTISPDGKSIVYAAEGPGGDLDLFLQRVDGRAAINLTERSTDDDYQPAFSPDGTQIAFRSERDGGGIFVMGATGESVRRISDFGFDPSWSPDGRQIVVATEPTGVTPESRNSQSSLYVLTIQTGERRLLLQQDGMQPAWSPGGERIAYWGLLEDSGQRDLWTISATAENPVETIIPVTSDAPLDWNPVWSADGNHLYFGSERDGTLNLWRIAIDAASGEVKGDPQQLNLPGRWAGHFSVARSTGSLVFSLLERSIEIRKAPLDPVTGRVGESRRVFGGSLLPFHWSVSADGSWVVLSTRGQQEDILLIRTDGTETRQLTNDAALDRGPSFSPDDSEIFFYSTRDNDKYEIWKIGIDGSGLKQVTDTEGRSLWQPWVSRDGRTVAVRNEQGTFLADLGDGIPVTELLALPPYPDQRFVFLGGSWSPEGNRLLGGLSDVATGMRTPGLVLFSLESDEYSTIDHSAFAGFFIDSGEIVGGGEQGLFILDPATGRRTPVDLEPRGGAISRDGTSIFIESRTAEADVWLLELEPARAE